LIDYNNLIACCLENKRCGNSKANKWNELFINPVTKNPEDYFEYDIKTGKIISIFKDGEKYEKAEYTIDLLNLNDNRLCNIRRKYILEFLSYSSNNENNLDEYALLKKLYTKENNKQKLENLKKILRNKI